MSRPWLRILPLTALAVGCTWVYPTEPSRPVPEGVVVPVFEEIPVPFVHRWDREVGHHLTGGAAIDVDGDGRHELFLGGGEGQPDALLAFEDGRLVDRIEGTGLSSETATYGSASVDLDGDARVDLLVARNDGVTLYLNRGGVFEAYPVPVSLPEQSVPVAVSVGDVDGDGDGDLYLSVFVDFPYFLSGTFNDPTCTPSRPMNTDPS